MKSRTTAPCHPFRSWRTGRWNGSTSLISLLGERTESSPPSFFFCFVVGSYWSVLTWAGHVVLLPQACYFLNVFQILPQISPLPLSPPPRLLWLYLRARHGRDGHSYCSVKGCERVKIVATTSTKQTCNCTAKAYPKYSKTPSHVVPMPQLNAQSCRGCGAKQVCIAAFKVSSVQLIKTH